MLRKRGVVVLMAVFLLTIVTLVNKDRVVNTIVYSTVDTDGILQRQREQIAAEMTNYAFPDGRTRYLDLVPELGGNPIKMMIVTTWRSGSSFLGDILASHPGVYYHYEPLMQYLLTRFRLATEAGYALQQIHEMLSCNYHQADFLAHAQRYNGSLLRRNNRLWQHCEDEQRLCYVPRFLQSLCQVFPLQLMKIVRIRLQLAQQFLADDRYNVRVVYLVRDPRGTLHSRQEIDWCQGRAECRSAATLCQDLESDFRSAVKLAALFPSKFLVLRYEDLSLDTFNTTDRIFKFVGLDFHKSVRQFLQTHTKVQEKYAYSTVKNSKKTAFRWQTEMDHSEVKSIQQHCHSVLKIWGYQLAYNSSHQQHFSPLLPFSVS